MKLGSIFASAAGSSGGNSTTRIAMPLSGGDRPIGLAALSSLNESPGGEESVIHRLAAGLPEPPGLSVRRLSNSAIALLLVSSPVTTRRISAALPLEHANMTMARDQNTLRIIASSHFRGTHDQLTAWALGSARPSSFSGRPPIAQAHPKRHRDSPSMLPD